MGLAFTIDSPVKVARFGINSVVSILEDHMIEKMREFYSVLYHKKYEFIPDSGRDRRWKRIQAYLNLMQDIIDEQIEEMKTKEKFGTASFLDDYFLFLPSESEHRKKYFKMLSLPHGAERNKIEKELRASVQAGRIDVNIMTKIDMPVFDKEGNRMPDEFSDAHSSLKAYAGSKLKSSLVLSAGLNPKLFSYIATYNDFLPDSNNEIRKKIILKVSDYRSALVQGKFLANKGLWVSEFRIESGLNCGGHAFPTEGLLMGPILQEFKDKRDELYNELNAVYQKAIKARFPDKNFAPDKLLVSAQGGIGTFEEDKFLREFYNLSSSGWGSPFLLVPEATTLDYHTLKLLSEAKEEDYYLSHASPLGIPFNNFKRSTSAEQKLNRINKGVPGSPCYKKSLSFNTEFTSSPICLASRQYQELKIKAIKLENFSEEQKKLAIEKVMEKECLCEGLSTPAILKHDLALSHQLTASAVCPGPNLAYFSGIFSLAEMIDHIYGRKNILNNRFRPNVFHKELKMYVDYLQKEEDTLNLFPDEKKKSFLESMRKNLLQGISYYKLHLGLFSIHLHDNLSAFAHFLDESELLLSKAKETAF